MNTIGKNRKKLNLSVTDLSKELSTSPSMIESWELGINMPELDQLIKMVEIFGKDADEILFGEVRSNR
ncbi:helix-turn-helix domain-containing protein [[Eubacterium] hominis]|uniref:helix-turn-helix domain-containing protein n=1 Tax=[Eubacterium] hominis TaxID=2764325 RepID=UPI003A4D8CA6